MLMSRKSLRKVAILLLVAIGIVAVFAGCGKKKDGDSSTDYEISNDSKESTIKSLLNTILDENESAENVIYDLTFPSKVSTYIARYEVVEGDAINGKGELTGKNTTEDQKVIVKCTYNKKEVYFEFVIAAESRRSSILLDMAKDELLHDCDNVRGNITLVDTVEGIDNSKVTWKSSDSSIITDAATGDNGEIPAGVVTRGDADQKVTLTATITCGTQTINQDYEVTVIAKPEEKEYTNYLYSYFRGSINGSSETQQIFFATSTDGLFWSALNKGSSVLKNTLGTKGVRDPFLLRSADGDHFYLIGTDLDANGGQWSSYGSKGSKCIVVWESDDLVNWSDVRLIEIAGASAGCMWAPEATYDPTTGEYIVYYASNVNGGSKRIYYVKTRDFWTFTDPVVYKNNDTVTYIDTTMTLYNGVYYRFTKNENELSILLETSDSVLGTYELVKKQIANQFGVEGPSIYKINGEEKWVLYMDGYAGDNSGVGYFPLIADSLADLQTANFRRLSSNEYKMPTGAKHGSFIPITQEEYEALLAKYN